MTITCLAFRRALQAIEKVDGMMIGEKTVQAASCMDVSSMDFYKIWRVETTIQMILKKYRPAMRQYI